MRGLLAIASFIDWLNEKIGFITFGSRVDLYLPPEAVLKISMGETVRGGTTVIAVYPACGRAGRPAKRREASVPAVRSDADAVDAGAANDPHPPTALSRAGVTRGDLRGRRRTNPGQPGSFPSVCRGNG